MTYPEPRYLGDRGEVSALYRPADQEAELTYANSNTAHYLATGASTDGLFGLYLGDGAGAEWPGPAFPSVDHRVVLHHQWDGPDLRRSALDRHPAG